MKKKLHYSRVLFLTVVTATVTLAACTANEESTKDKTKNSEASLKINSTSSSSKEKSSPSSTKSEGKTGTVTYTAELGSEEDKMEKKVTYKNGKIIAEETTEAIPYAGFGIKDKTEAESLISQKQKELENVEGVNYSVEYQEERAIESYKIDFTKVDREKIGFLSALADLSTIDEVEKLLLEMGYKKIEEQ
ncbi:DUF1307 domain-containing protein [Enterococcus sp. DIV0242_7C1]|uniref:Lipoprotein n=1 Tax=Candidatus Enterococcus dunnyi TaxID=1834192 RepID=A0A200J910_9ENTE|nr:MULTISPECIES: DUF1307 domain-containing protein [unclassified Enterococcus]MBO0470691.1 DUF1307 domain-containing protein [Enterococcus sp. DIV0242_7C1]OUZ33140.1 hypothetical protein A5889_001849 [Enterococcus sp. 9D6_DIV0238]